MSPGPSDSRPRMLPLDGFLPGVVGAYHGRVHNSAVPRRATWCAERKPPRHPTLLPKSHATRVFTSAGYFGHYFPHRYSAPRSLNRPGTKDGRVRLSGGRAPADTTSRAGAPLARLSGGRAPAGLPRAGAPLAAARLQCLQGGRVLGPCCKSKFVGVIWDRLSSPAPIVVDRI